MTSSNNRSTSLRDTMPLILEHLHAGQSVSFSPRGTSMLPMLRQGVDTVELSPAPAKLKKFDLPFYQRKNGQYVLHRIVRTGDAYTCVGDNQFELEYPVTHAQVLALVTAFTRNGRRIEVTNKAYRAYCLFWHYTRPLRHVYLRLYRLAAKCWSKLRPYVVRKKERPSHVS